MKTWLHIRGTYIKILLIFLTTLATCVVSTSTLQQTLGSSRTVTFTVHTARVPATHNHSHHNQCRTPYAAVHTLVILMMGIKMPETCCDKSLIINIRLVASCWFLSLHPTCNRLSLAMPIPVFESLSLSFCGRQTFYTILRISNSVFPKLIGHGTFSLSEHIFAESIIKFLYVNLRY